jgi:L-methionine (R)-S-oxide reductase
MTSVENCFVQLVGISTFLEQQSNLDVCLNDLCSMAAGLLNSENCSIMLLKDELESGDFRLRIFSTHGVLPPDALREAAKINEGIAGRVAATGQAILVDDINKSALLPFARRPDNPNRSFISAPILINGKVIGVLNISNAIDGRNFSSHDLDLAVFITLLIGKSTQVIQLQNLLNSRFAQLAMMREIRQSDSKPVIPISHEPAQLAKILAKSFYQEMNKLGLGRDHIIAAATEIVSLLNESLERHRKRSQRK